VNGPKIRRVGRCEVSNKALDNFLYIILILSFRSKTVPVNFLLY
jgi:hypothetical protein